MAEQGLHKAEVVGSTPTPATFWFLSVKAEVVSQGDRSQAREVLPPPLLLFLLGGIEKLPPLGQGGGRLWLWGR